MTGAPGWLTARQYDQCVGFVRRLLIDLAIMRRSAIYVFLDDLVLDLVEDVRAQHQNLNIATFKNGWEFETELALQAAADMTISRATNYQPYVAALKKGANITSPVPADGYMDEDSAGAQYQGLGLTKLLTYDDEQYVRKLLEFSDDTDKQKTISQNLEANYDFLVRNNLNTFVIHKWCTSLGDDDQ